MTIKGICCSCLGDVFESGDELDRLSESYHKCWSEMEVRDTDINAVDNCSCSLRLSPTYIIMHSIQECFQSPGGGLLVVFVVVVVWHN